MKRATYQRKLRLCGIRISHTSYAKTYRESRPNLLVMEHYLICPQRQRLVGRRKPVSLPISLSLALVQRQNRPQLIGCLSCHSKWQPTGAIPIGLAACQSHLSRPVSVRLRREKEEGLPLSLFIYFFVSRRKTTTAVYSFAGPPMFPVRIRENPGPYCSTY